MSAAFTSQVWCYVTFPLDPESSGWYPRGTWVNPVTCRASAVKPSGVPAGTHAGTGGGVAPGGGASVSPNGAGILIVILIVAAVYAWYKRKKGK
jgi:hypothetical protein